MPNRLVTTLSTSDLGEGRAVVLVHGVGIGAWAFAEVAAALASDHRVLVPHRRGYGPGGAEGAAGAIGAVEVVEVVEVPASASVDDQVDDLLRLLAARGIGEATFVGVSGGATLVLALAMAAPGMVRAAVVHEPVIGPLAPDLHAMLKAGAARLSSAPNVQEGVWDFMSGLVGADRMAALPASALRAVLLRSEVVRAEVPEFLAFAPTPADLARLRDVTLVATLGSRSPEPRQQAAAALAARAGAAVEVLEGVRHLPQLEAPEAFEKVIRTAIGAR